MVTALFSKTFFLFIAGITRQLPALNYCYPVENEDWLTSVEHGSLDLRNNQ